MVYLTDITEWEKLKQRFAEERMCLACVRFDNYEDVMKGLSESARANLNGEIGEILNKWVESSRGLWCVPIKKTWLWASTIRICKKL